MGTSFSQGTVPIDNQGTSGACYAYAAARVLNVSLRQFGLSNDNSIYYSILKQLIEEFGDDGANGRDVIQSALASRFIPEDLRQHLEMREYTGADSARITTALREGRQLYTGIRLYESQMILLRNAQVITVEDMLRVRNTSEGVNGHGVTLCERKSDGTLTFKNSLGPTAGQNGLFSVTDFTVLNQVPGRNVYFLDIVVVNQDRLPAHYHIRASLKSTECGPFLIPYDADATSFKKDKRVGKGGQGAVFAGTYKGQPAAIKERREKKGVIPSEVLCAFVHPNIVKSIAYTIKDSLDDPDDDIVQIASDFHVLGDLSPENQFMKQNGTRLFSSRQLLSYELAFRILFDVISALEDIHASFVVHADICPQNIVIGDDGSAKLCDFGSQVTLLSNTLTTGTRALGHIEYLDQSLINVYIANKNNTKLLRSLLTEYLDVFSFGKLVYYLLLGVPEVPAATAAVLVDFPVSWTPILRLADRCLSEDQLQRPTAAVIRAQMRLYVSASPASPSAAVAQGVSTQFSQMNLSPPPVPS